MSLLEFVGKESARIINLTSSKWELVWFHSRWSFHNCSFADAVIGVPMGCESATGQQLIVSMENMVPQRLLDQKLAEIVEKDDAINVLIQKVSHLDTLLQLKDQRIKDLTQQLQYLQERRKESSKQGFHFPT